MRTWGFDSSQGLRLKALDVSHYASYWLWRTCMPTGISEILNTTFPEDKSLGVALTSVARTATNNSADFTTPYGARGLRVWINETAHTSTPSTTFKIQDKDPISGVYTDRITSAAIATEGNTVLTIYPGLTPSANVVVSDCIGKTWRVLATHGNANSQTYSVGFSYLY